ncbi:MAG: O-antigen ligase family protein [Candidatus Sumerlaeota bacterium]|nr:O-antigen ligase family protein [Candidatus Sumerlaeota bacterium]
MGLSRNSYYRGGDWLMQAGILILLIVAPLEGHGQALYLAAQGLALAGMLGRCLMDVSPAYLRNVAIVFLAAVAALLLPALGYAAIQKDMGLFAKGAKQFFSQYSLILLATILLICHTDSNVYQRIRQHPKIAAVILAMLAFWFLTVAASLASLDPRESFRTVRKEIGLYLLLFLLVIESTRTWVRWRRLLAAAFIISAVVCCLSCLSYGLYIFADHSGMTQLKHWMDGTNEAGITKEAGNIVRIHSAGTMDIYVQAQFPFDHPNRLGSYGLIVTMLSLVVFSFSRRWKLRAWVIAGGLIAFLAIILSGTRGAMAAAFAGIVIWMLLCDWRYIIGFVAIIAVGAFLAPTIQKERLKSFFRTSTYTDTEGTFSHRINVGCGAIEMMRDHPWLGIGYGEEVFQKTYPAYKDRIKQIYNLKSLDKDVEAKSHAHNNLLQIGASSGIPAMIAFLVFALWLAAGLLRRWMWPLLEPDRFAWLAAALFAFWAALMIYGLSNFSLRRGVGMYLFLLFGAFVAFLQLSANPPVPQERPKK